MIPGRFAIANRDITVGEIVAVEKAVVSHMLPEYMGMLQLFLFKNHATLSENEKKLVCNKSV